MSLENKSGLDNVHQAMLNKRPPAPSALYCENTFDFPIRIKAVNPNYLLTPLLPGFDILKMISSWPKGHQRGN